MAESNSDRTQAVIEKMSRYNYLLDQTTYSHNNDMLPAILSEISEIKQCLMTEFGDLIELNSDGVFKYNSSIQLDINQIPE